MQYYFSYFSTKTYVVGTQKNRLNEHPKHMLKLVVTVSQNLDQTQTPTHNWTTTIN